MGKRRPQRTWEEQCLVIDAARWMREGVLHEGSTRCREAVFCVGYRVDTTDMTRPLVHLTYTTSDRQSVLRHFDYSVLLETTSPYFGRLRWWFTCPQCRRQGAETLPPGGNRFGCR